MKIQLRLQRVLVLLIAMFLLVTMIPLMGVRVKASSSLVEWDGTIPDGSALLNQTLAETTSSTDSVASMSLAANLYEFVPYMGEGYELHVGVVAVANSRGAMSYSTYSFQDSWVFDHLSFPKTLTLGLNSGVWLSQAYGGNISNPTWDACNFYGVEYPDIFVSSNGFIVLDSSAHSDNGQKWTCPNPTSTLPSQNAPSTLIAPLWRSLDPTANGAIVEWGYYTYGGSHSIYVEWYNIPNYVNGVDGARQTFAVLVCGDTTYPDGIITNPTVSFLYETVTDGGVPTMIEIQDQAGTHGYSISFPSNVEQVDFWANTNNIQKLKNIRVTATKTTDGVTEDGSTSIPISGLWQDSGGIYPGGINVETYTPPLGQLQPYGVLQTALDGAAVALGVLGVVGLCVSFPPPVGWFLGYGGLALGVEAFVNDLKPMPLSDPRSTVQPASFSDLTANTSNVVEDPLYPAPNSLGYYDAAVYATFTLRIPNGAISSDHYMDFNVVLTYGDEANTHNLTFQSPLRVHVVPNSPSDWYGRANPDGGYYNFNHWQAGSNTIYEVDAIDSFDQNSYELLGYNKISLDEINDYIVRPDGNIFVYGNFYVSDTLPPQLQSAYRGLNIYVMYSININQIVWKQQILGPSDPINTWILKGITVGGGSLTNGSKVKIGVGRSVSPATDGYNMLAEWYNVNVFDHYTADLTLNISVGGTVQSFSPGFIPQQQIDGQGNPIWGFSKDLQAIPDAGYQFKYWIVDGTSINHSNPITLTFNTDHMLAVYFVNSTAIPGDINDDGKVNLADLVLLANAYGTLPSQDPWGTGLHQWNTNADITEDGIVSLKDLVTLAQHYGLPT